MTPTINCTSANHPEATGDSALQSLLLQSEDAFYGSLQRIWNNVVKLEDLGIIQQENEKFIYAYRFAELELQRAFAGQLADVISPQTH